MKKLRGTLPERFWANVKKSDGCWTWTAGTNHGYGRLAVGGFVNKQVYAHQISYWIHVGAVPEGLQIDHLCRNRACVNPEHLEAVTQTENIRRGFGVSAICRRLTHCKHGHPFDEKNTRLRHRSNGVTERVCRTCHRLERATSSPLKSTRFKELSA